MSIGLGSLIIVSFSIIILNILNCAKPGVPPGGPEDKISPTILGSTPSNEAINVFKDNHISILFSEYIDRNSIKEAIFITPHIEGDIKYKWKKNLLNIILPDSFKDSTTYIVNIGSSIADLRRNKMKESYTFAFSTGSIINKGLIYGRVFKDEQPFANATVALYDSSYYDNNASFDSVYPPYMTQSGSDGTFKLEYLPFGDYYLIAFQDKNKNQWFNYPKELYGIPDRHVCVVLDDTKAGVNLFMTQNDSGDVSILSVGLSAENLIKLRLSNDIDISLIRDNLTRIFLTSSDDVKLNPKAVKERADIKDQSVFNLFFNSIIDDKYKVMIENSLINNNDTILYITSNEFVSKQTKDTKPPEIVSFSNHNKKIYPFDSTMDLEFSEAMNTTIDMNSSIINIMKSDSSFVDFNAVWLDPYQLDITIDNLEWSENYTLTVDQSKFCDFYGNCASDTNIVYNFSTFNDDSLGSISGNVVIDSSLGEKGDIYIVLNDSKGKVYFKKSVTNNEFNYQLEAGKYLLKGFLDKNNNGRHDVGSIVPFTQSEYMVFHPDTIRVRARFESAGIEFKF